MVPRRRCLRRKRTHLPRVQTHPRRNRSESIPPSYPPHSLSYYPPVSPSHHHRRPRRHHHHRHHRHHHHHHHHHHRHRHRRRRRRRRHCHRHRHRHHRHLSFVLLSL